MFGITLLTSFDFLDCEGILEIEPSHTKARTRKLRILEMLKRHNDALIEVCALQLKFMQDNRDKLRLGIPVTPPVPQSKIEELMALILPGEIEKTMKELEQELNPQFFVRVHRSAIANIRFVKKLAD